jgi:hypothetical protein
MNNKEVNANILNFLGNDSVDNLNFQTFFEKIIENLIKLEIEQSIQIDNFEENNNLLNDYLKHKYNQYYLKKFNDIDHYLHIDSIIVNQVHKLSIIKLKINQVFQI